MEYVNNADNGGEWKPTARIILHVTQYHSITKCSGHMNICSKYVLRQVLVVKCQISLQNNYKVDYYTCYILSNLQTYEHLPSKLVLFQINKSGRYDDNESE